MPAGDVAMRTDQHLGPVHGRHLANRLDTAACSTAAQLHAANQLAPPAQPARHQHRQPQRHQLYTNEQTNERQTG